MTNSQKKFGLDMNGNPNYGREVGALSHTEKSKNDKILAVRLEGMFWVGNKVDCSFFMWTLGLAFGGFTLWPSKSRGHGSSWPKVWTLGLAFEGFTLCPAEGSTYYILLAIFSSFLSTLNKVWPLNPTASRLGRP